MGRPYQNEMSELSSTYEWCLAQPVDQLSEMLGTHNGYSNIAVGSGGSYSAAALTAQILEEKQKVVSAARTPLGVDCMQQSLQTNVWLFSGSGRNIDIRRALKSASQRGAGSINIVCAKENSLLVREARALGIDTCFEFSSPVKKDGYLATNSLFATAVLITRAADPTIDSLLPKSFEALYADFLPGGSQYEILRAAAKQMATSAYNVVLHGPSGEVCGLDLESKFIEAAIAPLTPVDYRNFAHGRHNWLNRYKKSCHLLFLSNSKDRGLADATSKLLPEKTSFSRIKLPDSDPTARLISLLVAFDLTGFAANELNIDPGRPHIPEFGRKLYRSRSKLKMDPLENVPLPIVRKLRGTAEGSSKEIESQYRQSLETFLDRISQSTIEAIVLDYDGTLVETSKRTQPPSSDIVKTLCAAMETGVEIGIATGRGDSVHTALTRALPRSVFENIWIGYFNGSLCRRLTEDPPDDDLLETNDSLKHLAGIFEASLPLFEIDSIRSSHLQLSLRARNSTHLQRVFELARELISANHMSDIKVVVSGHSVDVLPKSTSKLALLDQLHTADGSAASILCVGDNGQWPGNDYELLTSPLSLSVDSVSLSPDTCWNLLPDRVSGPRGVIQYLEQITSVSGGASFKP